MSALISNPANPPSANALARLGHWMRQHQRIIMLVQWSIVLLYVALLIAPLFLAYSDQYSLVANKLRLFVQFLFWGIGWPLIMLSMMLFGRIWCGVFCPDGTLTEFASRHGRNQSIPRWLRWPGWPCTVLVLTTVYGQLVGVYEFHLGTLLLLGLPTLAAVWTGFSYGNGKRVWCMYLCPANGVFALLAKISPLHFQVDQDKWKHASIPLPRIDCPTLIDIRRMQSASGCHACGRCSGYINAVELAVRPPDSEILAVGKVSTAESVTLIFGILGVCTLAMQWMNNSWFLFLKSSLSSAGLYALDQYTAPWWLLANYPQENQIFTLLDGLCILIYTLGGGILLGAVILATVWLAAKVAANSQLTWQKLSLALIPIAGIGLFLGLSSITLRHLQQPSFVLESAAYLRAGLLIAGSLFSLWLGMKLILPQFALRRIVGLVIFALPIVLICLIWIDNFFA